MNVSFNKQMDSLEREVLFKSVDLDDDIDDFKFEIDDFQSEEEIIAIAPKCIRCNLCVEACPVDAIEPANNFKIAKITDKCVKCEICVQSCPISAIKLISNSVIFKKGDDSDKGVVEYSLVNISRPHRVIRMDDISIDYSKCNPNIDYGQYCPTGALTLEFKEFLEENEDINVTLEEDTLYPYINKKLCIGCGACINLCMDDEITLERTIGPIIHIKDLTVDQETCVACFLCEDNCPVEAIKLIDNEVVLDDDKCIRCISCTNHCPVGALKFVNRNNGDD